MDWTPEAWAAALAAMRQRASAAEILPLYEGGAISGLEVLNGACEPALRAELVRQFQYYPDEFIADIVGGGLKKLAGRSEAPPPADCSRR